MSRLCVTLQADAELMTREMWTAKEEYEEAKQIRVPLAEFLYTYLSKQVMFSGIVPWRACLRSFLLAILLFCKANISAECLGRAP